MYPKSPTDILEPTQMQDQGTVSHFYSPAHIYIFAEPLNWLSTGKRLDDFIVGGIKCPPGNRTGNILFGSTPTYSDYYWKASLNGFLLSLMYLFPVSFCLLYVRLLIKQQGDVAVKFTHCAVYCVALRSSWNFINSVSFYSLLIHSFTYRHAAVKIVPLVKESICLLDWAYLKKVRTW